MSLRLLAAACALLSLATAASAADRNYTVTGFDRVRIDGPYRVRMTTGVAPFAKASGSQSALDGVSVEVQGRTLIVHNNPRSWGGYPGESPGPVEISVGTHDLSAVWVNGAGALAIDKARGQSLDLSVQGPGSISLGRAEVDRLRINMTGSGSAVVGGNAADASLFLRGSSSLDGSGLTVKDAKIGATGSSVVAVIATGTAKVDTLGTATVELGGNPACTVNASGSAVVRGCR